ncbi:MAG: Radical SAM superfamily protein [Planctomycetes bacterium ADurb.Bin412]|nr:MAG: Radical SAM superfamily protein [Planctomycetes bacterium ADurb.Bin412]
MFQRVLCVYPYRQELHHVGFFPPLGLECIAAAIKPYARNLDLVDLRKENACTSDFLRPDTDLVCFSVNWDREADFLHHEISSVPPGLFTILGGRFATENPEKWLSEFPQVSAVVRGDGEEAITEICRGVPLEQIAGLSFRRNGAIIHNPNRTLGPISDDNYPDRSLRRHSYEAELEDVPTGILIDSVSGSRGCPFNCTFCAFSRNPWGEKRKWSARSPESIVAELEGIKAQFVAFTDDLFTYDMDRVARICDLILARGIRKKYIINARLEIAKRPDVLRKMEKAGFALLMLGVESTQDKTLRSMHKGFTTAGIRDCFQVLRRSSMLLNGYFILGNIGETKDEMRQISPFAHELGLDFIALSTLRFSPYSGLDELVANSPGYYIAPSGKVYSDQCSVSQLRQLRRQINREFFSPRQIRHLTWKAIRNGALRFLPGLFLRLPKITWLILQHKRQKARRRAHRRRPSVS